MEGYDDRVPTGKVIGIMVLAIAAIMVLGFVFQGYDFFLYKFFAPKQEAVRREVYEQTKSYKDGSVQRLNTLCTQVVAAEESGKSMLNQVIVQEFASWSSDDVPDYLRPCLATARAKTIK